MVVVEDIMAILQGASNNCNKIRNCPLEAFPIHTRQYNGLECAAPDHVMRTQQMILKSATFEPTIVSQEENSVQRQALRPLC